MLARLERGTVEERHRLVEDRLVAGRLDVMRRDVGEPHRSSEMRVRTPLAAGREPPMLDVALDELPRRCAQDLLARQLGPCHGEAP